MELAKSQVSTREDFNKIEPDTNSKLDKMTQMLAALIGGGEGQVYNGISLLVVLLVYL